MQSSSATNGLSKSSHMDLKGMKGMHKANETNLLGESLENFLTKKRRQLVYWEFLKSEFCEENLDFWLACQEFRTLDCPEQRTKSATRIYEEFIKDDSPRQVNLDFYTRENIRQSLEQPTASCFAVAQGKIYSLMKDDSFPRFIESKHYKVLIDEASKQRGIRKHRVAVRVKSNGDDLKINGPQKDLLLMQKQ